MEINRRSFIGSTAFAAAAIGTGTLWSTRRGRSNSDLVLHEGSRHPDSFSITPVVGDGKWIWREPPKDGSTGYLEPREFEVTTGIELLGKGYASEIRATTMAPLEFPEQNWVPRAIHGIWRSGIMIDDWYQLQGKRPEMSYTSTVEPLATEEETDLGPGRREKLQSGRWKVGGGREGSKRFR